MSGGGGARHPQADYRPMREVVEQRESPEGLLDVLSCSHTIVAKTEKSKVGRPQRRCLHCKSKAEPSIGRTFPRSDAANALLAEAVLRNEDEIDKARAAGRRDLVAKLELKTTQLRARMT